MIEMPMPDNLPDNVVEKLLREPQHLRLVILESPFAGDIERNLRYARACLHDCLLRREAPIASHLLYTQPGVLDDNIPNERQWGINAGLAWSRVAQAAVFYTDLDWSGGMIAAREHHRHCLPCEERQLPSEVLAKVLCND